MPLLNIPYQPGGINIVRPTDCFGCDPREYCDMVAPGDTIFRQFKQTPCGNSITCDGDFTSIAEGANIIPDPDFNDLGAEELVNGNFTGDADFWGLGAGWAYNSNNIRKTAGSATSAFQILPTALVDEGIYRVVFTVSNYSAGTVLVSFTGGVPVSGTLVSANGTYTQYLKATAGSINFNLNANAAFAGDIDTVSVRRIAATWDFNGEWTINAAGHAFKATLNDALVCPGVVSPFTNYTLTIEITDGSGFIRATVGGVQTTAAVVSGGAQTYTLQVTSGAGTDLVIDQVAGSFDLEIDDVELVEIDGDCWDFDTDLWLVTNGSLCKIPGSSDILTNSTVLTGGEHYQIKITIAGRTAGSISMTVDSVTSPVMSANQTHIQYFSPVLDSTLSIFASSTFDGCISNVEIFLLRNDYLFELRDLNNNTIAVINGNSFGQQTVFYNDDYVTLRFKLTEILDIDDRPIAYGCYKIWGYDLCEIQYEEIIQDGECNNPFTVYWFDSGGTPDVTNTITANRLLFDRVTSAGTGGGAVGNKWDGTSWQGNPGLPLGPHNYRVSFEIISNTDTFNITAGLVFGDGSGSGAFSTVGIHTVDVFNVNPLTAIQQTIQISTTFNNVAGTIEIDNISVVRIEPFDETFVSKCLTYEESFDCTKYVMAYCVPDSFGFKFFDDLSLPVATRTLIFALAQRIYLRAVNPVYPQVTDDYLYSTGTKSRNFAQSEKVYSLITDALPEWVHDALRLQVSCQEFFLGEPPFSTPAEFAANFIAWFVIGIDYTPKWSEDGEFMLVPARIDIQKKETDVKFFRNL